MEVKSNGKDMSFQKEVRDCLKEQLTFISELQTEMFKELDNSKRNFKEMTWQIAKLETDIEGNSDVKKKIKPPTSVKRNNHIKIEEFEKAQESTITTSYNWMSQTNELIVDFIKLQNIINFEIFKGPDG
jgi:hypothetical protein